MFLNAFLTFYYSSPVGVRSIVINPCVCLSVCVFVCPREYLWNRWTYFHEILCADPLWLWPSPLLAALRYVMLPVFWMTSRLAVMGRMAMRGDRGAESGVYECLVCTCDKRFNI